MQLNFNDESLRSLVFLVNFGLIAAMTAMNASSLTTDSNAIASIMPSWCSVTSIFLVPNRIAKTAIAAATSNAVL